jgi:pyruvate/2-oxoglutarate dehydrogenase complex dihydrolipoamide dehydrogenase (E3) component
MTDTDFDLIVLGLGPGGEAVAQSLAKSGRRVLGIDPRLVGGECPYFGCIPSKMLLRGAQTLAETRRVDALAGHAEARPDFTPVADRIRDEATDDWNDQAAVRSLQDAGAQFVRGAGALAGRDSDGRLVVTVGEDVFRAPRVLVSTGTAPAMPPITGLAEFRASGDGVDGPVWTNREALRAREAPASLVVLGGGAIGCELAQGFARFGTAVTIVEMAERLLPGEEPEAATSIAEVFTREGTTVRTGVGASRVSAGGDGVLLELGGGGTTVTGAKLLVTTGRSPNLSGIGLDSVGLDEGERSLDVDERMRVLRDGSPLEGLYAIGDITGHGQFTHVAVWQAQVLTAHLQDKDVRFGGYHGLAWATFTDPEVGRVGITEAQARDSSDGEVRVGMQPISSNARGWIYGPGNDGFVKLVADGDLLVGATVVAPNGGEIMGLVTLAVHARVPIPTLLGMHYVFPTMHRAVLEALQDLVS